MKKEFSMLQKAKTVIFRNDYLSDGKPAKKNRVNLEFWSGKTNVGDQLSYPIVEWMLKKKNLDLNSPTDKTKHLLALGSIIGSGHFDATVWGSGVNTPVSIYRAGRWRRSVSLSIRAIRGPITKETLESFGYDCSQCVYGDPGILMPLIYQPENGEKKYDFSIICHFKTSKYLRMKYPNYHYIDVNTMDYEAFIREIVSSKRIISSSLHGIILAESYGITAVFLNEKGLMDREIVKYYDWYYATDRRSVICASSIEEAIKTKPMDLPELDAMRKGLMDAFPYDLWED